MKNFISLETQKKLINFSNYLKAITITVTVVEMKTAVQKESEVTESQTVISEIYCLLVSRDRISGCHGLPIKQTIQHR